MAASQWEPMAAGDSGLHRMDPRAKMIIATAFSLVVAMGRGWSMLGLALGLGLLVIILARVPWGPVFKRLAVVNFFIAFLWLTLPFTLVTGDDGWRFTLDPRGVEMALVITLKANAIVLVVMGMVSTTPVVRLLHALHHMKVSDKLVHLFMFFFRYIHVFNQEYQRMRRAMRVRAFVPKSNLHTYRAMANLVGMLLVRSYDRAERVYQAMLCRGFTGTYWVLDHFHWHRRDTWLSYLAALGLAVMVWAAAAMP